MEYAVDWRKIATKTQRDFFGMILDGKIKTENIAEFGFIAQWDRLGNNLDTIKNNCDNVVLNVFAKVDFAKFTKNLSPFFCRQDL
ncbi:MAG: hypothetical protein FWD66_03825 [Paludibacter sp.]|nr:hypothetical protein [Paludibacter sp.]